MPFQKWGARQEQSLRLQLAGSTFSAARTGRKASSDWEESTVKSAGPNFRSYWPWPTWTSPRWPWRMPESRTPPFLQSAGQPMSTTNQLRHAQQRLRSIAAEWPADPLRPKIQLKTFLAALAEHPALSPRAAAATNALHQNRVSSHVSGLSSH